MRIAGTASAAPSYFYSQSVLLEAFKAYWAERLENPRMLERLWANAGVEGRNLVQPMEAYLAMDTWGKANQAWMEGALELGSTALCGALADAGRERSEMGALFFVSITGISSPSIDALLINKMGLPLNLRRTPIFGWGCVGGAAGIARAADYVRAYPDQIAAVLSVELCSLTLQRDDVSMANQISSALFADGAAAAVVAGDAVEARGPRIVDTRSSFYPDTEDVMGWAISEKGFQIVLSPEVPNVIRANLRRDADAFLAEHGLSRADIGCWVLHTGGPKVLRATEEALELDESKTRASWDVLRRTGNVSSASVLLVLEEIMKRRRPDPGTWSVLAAMGPGFCSELVLMQW
ncbi:MAG TPA: 3-oxoacyl-[acyl-carrier-protein] synthase III C-terminal domain-containing protein [Bryobacteraceae bacterium]|nr:3-oxoacyl-[acyl-carrier-protein] synthase III C-terminal domain-containing protein [Bryobacteraceae bacterium]